MARHSLLIESIRRTSARQIRRAVMSFVAALAFGLLAMLRKVLMSFDDMVLVPSIGVWS
jgi:ABC-type enterochelin transport system permease subunit